MKSLEEKIVQYVAVAANLMESKTVSIAQVLELKKWVSACDKLSAQDQHKIKLSVISLKLSLKIIRAEHFKIENLQNQLQNYLNILETDSLGDESVKSLAVAIRHLEDFSDALHFSVEELGPRKKQNYEADLSLLEFYIDIFKIKLRELIVTEEKDNSEEIKNSSLNQFLKYLKVNSLIDHEGKSVELDLHLKNAAKYLYKNPQWYADLKVEKSIYIPTEKTGLKFPLQIKNTENGFELYVNLKCKLEDWVKSGLYKKVKKSQMLIKGIWENGVEAVVYGKKDSKEHSDKINATRQESKYVQHLNPLYVHQIHPAAAYFHGGKYKQSFMSQWADGGTIGNVMGNPAVLKAMSIGELFLLCYSTAAALSYLHSPEVNLVHKDLHSDNFLIFSDNDGIAWAKISDFGLSEQGQDINEKISDLWQLAANWHGLLLKYAECRDLQNHKSETFDSLLSLGETIDESSEEKPIDGETVMEYLHEILAKMRDSEPVEAAWVQEKIEKRYHIKLSKPEADSQQRFFPSSGPRLSLNDSPINTYSF